jgi:hypothetical protein
MSNDNPYEPGSAANGGGDESKPQEKDISPEHAAYNVVADTVVGLNVRKSDNKFQAIFIVVSILLSAAVGAVVVALNGQWEMPWYAGALAGAFAGLVIGFFASGIVLMVFRAVRHMQGKHE